MCSVYVYCPTSFYACVLSHFSRVLRLFATLWTVARQAPLSMGFFSKNIGVGCYDLFLRAAFS